METPTVARRHPDINPGNFMSQHSREQRDMIWLEQLQDILLPPFQATKPSSAQNKLVSENQAYPVILLTLKYFLQWYSHGNPQIKIAQGKMSNIQPVHRALLVYRCFTLAASLFATFCPLKKPKSPGFYLVTSEVVLLWADNHLRSCWKSQVSFGGYNDRGSLLIFSCQGPGVLTLVFLK